ncbi:hypothetical protein [Oceanicaulis sp.]|uniref:hypothetical protein n=1 Tax=Oceanicaulis sp. TaxID=1924941 RepID=UPI003D2A3228
MSGSKTLVDPDPVTIVLTGAAVVSAVSALPSAIETLLRMRNNKREAQQNTINFRQTLLRKILNDLNDASESISEFRHQISIYEGEGRASNLDEPIQIGRARLDLSIDEISLFSELYQPLALANNTITNSVGNYLRTASLDDCQLDSDIVAVLSGVGEDLSKILVGDCSLREALRILDGAIFNIHQELSKLRLRGNR